MIKNIIALLFCASLISCSNPYKQEAEKSARSSAAKSRLDSSQSGTSSVFKDID